MEAADVSRLSRRVLAGVRCILQLGLTRLDPDHYRVPGIRPGAASVRVYRRGATWRCSSDRRHDESKPCAHILAVLETVGAVRLPATVSPRAEAARRDALEAEAARLLPERLPRLLMRMLDASPAALPPPPGKGRPRCSQYAVAHQAVMRAATRSSLRSSPTPGPYPAVSRSTLTRFLKDPATLAFLDALREWTLAAARPLDATRPDACNRSTLTFTTPTGSLSLVASWTPSYGLLAHLEPGESCPQAPGAEEAAKRFLALVGGELAGRDATAQLNEARCMALAHNLARLLVLELERP